jgi:hypothetical protein
VQINTGLQRTMSIHILTPARQSSDENIAPPRTRANAAARLETIHAWHLQVHEDDLRPEQLRSVNGLASIGCRLYYVAFEFE